MAKGKLQTRFIGPVSAFVILVVLGGAVIFSALENRRIAAEVTLDAAHNRDNILQILGITDALVMEQTKSAMHLLMDARARFRTSLARACGTSQGQDSAQSDLGWQGAGQQL